MYDYLNHESVGSFRKTHWQLFFEFVPDHHEFDGKIDWRVTQVTSGNGINTTAVRIVVECSTSF
jgi:hypothetical protein